MNEWSSVLVACLACAALFSCARADASWRLKYLAIDVGTNPYMSTIYAWQNLTGGRVEIVAESVNLVKKDMDQDITSDHLYDIYQKSGAWPVFQYGEGGGVEDLTNDVRTNPEFDWTGISSVQRKVVTSYKEHTYSIPVDADPLVYYYRRDLMTTPPTTWEEMISVAARFHGQDLNGDGTPDYGICIITESYLHIFGMMIANTVYRYAPSKRQHFLYDVDNETSPAELNLDTAGWEYALDITKSLYQYSQKRRLVNNYKDAQTLFFSGRCASSIHFGSLGAMTVDNTDGKGRGTYMRGKMGVARTPGSKYVYDRTQRRLVTCDIQTCPYQEYGNVNRNHFMTGGAQIMVRKGTPNRAAAISFAAYFSTHVDVRSPGSCNPFRATHYDPADYVRATPVAWDADDAKLYTASLYDTMVKETTATLPETPNVDIIATLLSSAIEEYIRLDQYANYTTSAADCLARAKAAIKYQSAQMGWTSDVIDRDMRTHLGLPQRATSGGSSNAAGISLAIIIPLAVVIATVAIVYVKVLPYWAMRNAPKDATKPFGTMFIALKAETLLWERFPSTMPKVTATYTSIVRKCCSATGCHEVKMIGGSFMIVAKSPEALLQCAREVAVAFHHRNLSSVLRRANDAATAEHKSSNPGASAPADAHISDNESARSGEKSDTASNRSARTGTEVGFGIGLHWGTGRIQQMETTNAYDYSGPSVEGAAIVSDAAAAHQILVTQDVDATSVPAAELCDFLTRDISHRAVAIRQYTPNGLPTRQFVQPTSQDTQIDSLASTIEQQSMGVTSKRVTVLSARIHNFSAFANGLSKESFAEQYRKFIADAQAVIDREKGNLQSFSGGRFTVTFNAINPTPQQQMRAFNVARAIVEAAKTGSIGRVSCGIATANALVGSFALASSKSAHWALVSEAAEQAMLLERMCCLYADVRTLTTSTNVDELSPYFVLRFVDVVQLPHTTKPVGIVSLIEPKATRGATDEWMYELQNNEKGDLNHVVNAIFCELLKSVNDGTAPVALDLSTVPESMHSFLDVPRAVMSVHQGSVASYVESKKELFRLYTPAVEAPPSQAAASL